MRVAINGYGRVGRCVLRAAVERRNQRRLTVGSLSPLATGSKLDDFYFDDFDFDIVAINEIASLDAMTYLTRYDSTHGAFPGNVQSQAANATQKRDCLQIDGASIELLHEADPSQLPWDELGVDIVFECTGQISQLESANQHLRAGAKQVLLSNPGEFPIPALVYGVNHQHANVNDAVLSAASCTSNALIPVLSILDQAIGIENGVITTIHASMHDQPVIDAYHSDDLRRNRAASQSIIPVATELASGIGRVLPKFEGKFVAHALRVPVNNVSALNVTLNLTRDTSATELNRIVSEAAHQQMNGILGYTDALLASCDFNHDARSGIVDGNQTLVSNGADSEGKSGRGNTANVLIWFDNEWAFANRMIDLAAYIYRT